MAKRVGANRKLRMKENLAGKRNVSFKLATKFIKTLSFLFLILGIVVGGIFGGRILLGSTAINNFLPIKTVMVKGNKICASEWILSTADIDTGSSLLFFKKSNLAEEIKRNLWIKKVSFMRKFPSTLVINVTERIPLAYLNAGSISIVDDDGFTWPMSRYGFLNIPVIGGLNIVMSKDSCTRLDKKSLVRMNTFFDAFKKNSSLSVTDLKQMIFSKDGFVIITVEKIPANIIINEKNIDEKFRQFSEIIARSDGNGRKILHCIDLSHERLAYVR